MGSQRRRARTIHGASVGILMLDAAFPRPPGDIGNAETWPFPVHYRVVRNASAAEAVLADADALKPAFIAAARDLEADGVDGITTSCGFLSLFQDDLKAAVGIPVAASSLMQVPVIAATLPAGMRPGIFTISAETLTPRHLAAAGAPADTPVFGVTPDGPFAGPILRNAPEMDFAAAARDLEASLTDALTAQPDLGAVVLECTNMAPFADRLSAVSGLPVYSIYSFVTWFQSGLRPRSFGQTAARLD
ncbi:MAG: aspartate/glutamate racemase family protein [Pseudomonadota bacterium]